MITFNTNKENKGEVYRILGITDERLAELNEGIEDIVATHIGNGMAETMQKIITSVDACYEEYGRIIPNKLMLHTLIDTTDKIYPAIEKFCNNDNEIAFIMYRLGESAAVIHAMIVETIGRDSQQYVVSKYGTASLAAIKQYLEMIDIVKSVEKENKK